MSPMQIEIIAPQEQPIFRPLGRRLSELQEDVDLIFRMPDGEIRRIRAFKGEKIDGASIPRLCWTLIGLAPHGVMDGPALWHDPVYKYQGKMPHGVYQRWDGESWVDCDEPISKGLGDAILYALCLHFNVGDNRSYLVWLGVRIGGWWAWNRDDHKRMRKVELKVLKEKEMFP